LKVAVGCGRIVVGCTGDIYRGLTYGPGAVYVYTLGGSLLKRIEAPLRPYFNSSSDDTNITLGFGASVAVGDGRIAVASNRIYLYDLNGEYIGPAEKLSAWVAEITQPSMETLVNPGDGTKDSISIGNGVMVIGNTKAKWSGSTTASGAAFLFDYTRRPIRLLGPTVKTNLDYFGHATAIGCGKVAVSAVLASVGSTNYVGKVYLYDLNGENEIIIEPPDGSQSDYFGWSVAIGSGRVFVGCTGDDDNTSSASGSVYVYDLHGQYIGKIYASDYGAADQFGTSLATSNGKLVVGATGDDNNGSNSGSAYLFDINVQERHFLDLIDGR
jgi:WD40 repeat protein